MSLMTVLQGVCLHNILLLTAQLLHSHETVYCSKEDMFKNLTANAFKSIIVYVYVQNESSFPCLGVERSVA